MRIAVVRSVVEPDIEAVAVVGIVVVAVVEHTRQLVSVADTEAVGPVAVVDLVVV
jgi:hypothetical protein